MSAGGRIAGAIVLTLVAAAGGYWYGKVKAVPDAEHHDSTTAPSDSEPAEEKSLVPVVTQPLKQGQITETITAYGSVIAEQADVHVVSVPFESRVVHVFVAPGQPATRDGRLINVEASPDTQVALQEAKNVLEAAKLELQQTDQRFTDHLATNTERLQARQAVQAAELKLKSLMDRGVGETQQLKAPFDGIVSKVDVQEGQIVPAGGTLLEVAAGNRFEARLGVDPADTQSLQVDQPVTLHPVGASGASTSAIEGKIRTIGRRVDPATRMIEVLVSLPENTNLLLDSFVTGAVTRASAADALILPRDAALPGEAGEAIVYTVRDGKAVKHTVHLGLETDREVQVIAEDLKPGDPVVTSGNYLLEDGMRVEAKP